MNHVRERFPRELVDIFVGDLYILFNRCSFIWTSINVMFIFCRYKITKNKY
jgi:hypothetical protein